MYIAFDNFHVTYWVPCSLCLIFNCPLCWGTLSFLAVLYVGVHVYHAPSHLIIPYWNVLDSSASSQQDCSSADTEMIALNYGKLIDRTNVFLSLSLFYCCFFNFFFIGITCNGWIFSFLFLKGTLWSLLYTSNLFDVLEFTFLNNSIFKKKENNTFVSVMFF